MKRYWKKGRTIHREERRVGNFIWVDGEEYHKNFLPKNMREATQEEFNAQSEKISAKLAMADSGAADGPGAPEEDAVERVHPNDGDNDKEGKDGE